MTENIKKLSDRDKVNAYLDHIKEDNSAIRAFVLKQCGEDKEARAFYIAQFDRYIGIRNETGNRWEANEHD